MSTWSLRNQDCVQFLKTLPDASVGLVIADPPYNIGYDGGEGWDSPRPETEYLEWCREWVTESARVLMPGRMLVVWGSLKTDTFLRLKLDVLNHVPGLKTQQEIIWSYNWGGRTKKNFARKHEMAWCFSKGSDFLFNSDDVRVPRKVAKSLRTGRAHAQGTIPTAVWEKNNHTMSRDFVAWHPTTKNVEVLDRMVRGYTNPGDTVIDPFSGSASTGVAALRAGRDFIGADLNAGYIERARDRLSREEN